jgi:hypothetical protein
LEQHDLHFDQCRPGEARSSGGSNWCSPLETENRWRVTQSWFIPAISCESPSRCVGMRISEPKQRNRPERYKSSNRYKAACLAVNDKFGGAWWVSFSKLRLFLKAAEGQNRAQELKMFVGNPQYLPHVPVRCAGPAALQDSVGKSACRQRTVSLGDQRRRFGRVFRSPSLCTRLLTLVSSAAVSLPSPLGPSLSAAVSVAEGGMSQGQNYLMRHANSTSFSGKRSREKNGKARMFLVEC